VDRTHPAHLLEVGTCRTTRKRTALATSRPRGLWGRHPLVAAPVAATVGTIALTIALHAPVAIASTRPQAVTTCKRRVIDSVSITTDTPRICLMARALQGTTLIALVAVQAIATQARASQARAIDSIALPVGCACPDQAISEGMAPPKLMLPSRASTGSEESLQWQVHRSQIKEVLQTHLSPTQGHVPRNTLPSLQSNVA